ncbi:ThuA domain-containing protein [Dyadobacter psychrotolerans]|uniref:ThuA domain-containing protein n=1 Tax=Dyadobacter psychrotolerans TaxID=2541721 RepID=A0A4R5DWN5_9BACT|nr:ThuA domain-containing protein [Dyadobacter psychrotolerans]TDE16571.1 ThuA domain-containing protein [Dyadobacter psychrotolerans]
MIKVSAIFLIVILAGQVLAQEKKPKFRVLALSESGGHHVAYSKAAKIWLNQLARTEQFSIDYIENTDQIDDGFLTNYQVFIQLDFVPYAWKPGAVNAFEKYIKEGKGGWIGFHHATLLGDFDGYKIWPWFSEFMGGIRYKNYIATFASATVKIEDRKHPIMKGVPVSFFVKKEEWYTYDKSPRPNVHVIASVDESTYSPDSENKMGDHPVIWSNKHYKARNVYIFMGHDPVLFESEEYKTIFKNAIHWAAKN